MTWDHLHEEEARSTDHDADAHELAGVAPPCDDCGKREAVKGGLCDECLE